MLTPSIFSNNFFDDMFEFPFTKSDDAAKKQGIPIMKTDIQEHEGSYLLDIELPGYKKEDVKAELNDGYLTVSAEKNEEKEEKDKRGNYIRRERYTGQCQRSFYVGKYVTQEDIKASFEEGLLKIQVPKMEQPKVEEKKYIAID